jgi:hypothetical protein
MHGIGRQKTHMDIKYPMADIKYPIADISR